MNPTTSTAHPNPSGDSPEMHLSAFADASARLVGNVRVGAGSFVGPMAVLRADEPDADGKVRPIVIGPECNVQDGVIIHALRGAGVTVGRGSSIAHGAIVHGPADIGDGCFVGFRAVVFDAVLGEGAFIGAAAVVQGVRLPAGAVVAPGLVVIDQDQADALPQANDSQKTFMRNVAATNVELAAGYNRIEGE